MKVKPASKLKIHDWLHFNPPGSPQRIVDIEDTRDGEIKVFVDYGNGGEPGTMFFRPDEIVAVVS